MIQVDTFMKLNTEKCHLMVLCRNSNQRVTVNVGNSVIENMEEEKLLGVVIDKQLNFETHVTKLCQKAGNKLFPLLAFPNTWTLINSAS